jgi:hypothetical protein
MVHRRSQIAHSRNSKFEMFYDRPSFIVSRQRSPGGTASCLRTYVPSERLLLDAKRAGLIPAVGPLLDQLDALRFRVAPHTRTAVLKLAGE